MTYDEKVTAAETELKPLLTDKFLETLALAAKTHGHSGDYIETCYFVEWCFDVAEKEKPDLSPLDYDS